MMGFVDVVLTCLLLDFGAFESAKFSKYYIYIYSPDDSTSIQP